MSAAPATGGGGGGAQPAASPHHHCSDCGVMFDSAASLQVHLHYHQEAMMSRASWGPPANNSGSPTDPDNNNHAPKKASNVIAAADSSDNQMVNVKQEPGVVVKQEAPPQHPQQQQAQQQQQQHQQQQQQHVVTSYHATNPSPYDLPPHQQYSPSFGYDVYYGLENPYMSQDFMGKHPSQQMHQQQRYQPYQHSPRVSSSSPSSAPGGVCMPSPSPVQCDKCGMVCETATQLQEHALSHSDAFQYPPMPATASANSATSAKDSSSEILDLDSHKVVYPAVLPSLQSLQGMQPQWQDATQPPPHQLYHQPAFPSQSASQDVKLFRTPQDHAMQQQQAMQQASHPPHMVSPPDFPTTTTPQQHDNGSGGGFRPAGAGPQITSSHPVAPGTKGAGWKSNEARRPKTYNCTACNKWFTSSGHLKRHYNTTLHKNAVKSSGQPDPANMPISAHHHPGRDPNHPSHHKGGGISPTRRIQNQQRSPEPQGFPAQSQPSPGPGGYILPHSYGSFTFPGIPPDTGQPPPGAELHHQQQIESNNTGATNTNHISGSPPNGQAGPSVHNLLQIPRGLQTHNSSATTNNTVNNTMEETVTCHMQQVQAQQAQAQSARSLISYRRPQRPPPHITTPRTTDMPQEHQDQRLATTSRQHQEESRDRCTTTNTLFLVIPPGNRIMNSHHTTGDTSDPVVALRDPPYAGGGGHHMDYGMLVDPLQHPPFSPAMPMEEPSPPSPPQRVTSTEPDAKPAVHRCDACDKLFNKACYLTQHNKSFHSGEKPFKCGRCGKRFISETAYEEHIAKHAGDKPFKCAECPKQFNHKTDLRRHMCLHSGSKPYACHLCGKGFVRKDHMLKHCETHRKKPKEANAPKRAAAVQA